MNLIARHTRSATPARATVFIGILSGMLFPAVASASPRLRCQLTQGDMVQVVDVTPVQNPYAATAVDLKGNFRFKAVVIGDEQKIDYIKLYTYYQSKRQAVLLHEANYLAPVAHPAQSPAALTGMNYLYSPDLGREFKYACALLEVKP
ncbi:hypothetical protein [Propionivibrio sp.]|uniref:hypothetical protein n=1 Tax=Propionivibrio sp. TaxID=2212460 RepID=UPI003BF55740